VRGRNPIVERVVKVKLPEAPVGGEVDAKPRMTTPKTKTGPSNGG
jgi:hypothetical protein